MPSKIDKIKLGEFDRRRKLTDQQIEEIKHKRENGGMSLRALGREYNVDKATIKKHTDPEFAERVKARNKAQYDSGLYRADKKQQVENTRNVRKYKRKLHEEGKI